MSTKMIYTCDICKAEQTKPDQFWILEPTLRTIKSPSHNYSHAFSIQLCRKCIDKHGLIYLNKEQKEAAKENPKLSQENLIINFLRELIREELSYNNHQD